MKELVYKELIRLLVGCVAIAGGMAGRVALGAELPLDLLITNGTIIDGTGRLGYQGDVGIRNGRIVVVGDSFGYKSHQKIDARGLVVAPGFIDSHSHVGEALAAPENRLNELNLRQGVTTIVDGADGDFSPTHIRPLIDAYNKQGIGTNVAFYVGHNGIRQEVMGSSQQRAPNAAELERMRELVREGMELGALGFSTGLMYDPGRHSTTEEVVALAKEVAPFDGIYDTHVRDPMDELLESDAEAIEIGRRANIPVKLGHLKAVGPKNKGKIHDVIKLVNTARSQGQVVVSDQYPYDGAATMSLADVLIWDVATPSSGPVDPPSRDEQKRLLADPNSRANIMDLSVNGIDGGFTWIKAVGYGGMRIVSSADFPQMVGQFITRLAAERNISELDLIIDLVRKADKPVKITPGAIDEADVQDLLTQHWNMICSDGSWVVEGGEENRDHPRSTGSFAKVLGHYARDLGLIDLPEAIRRMTSFTAEFLRLYDRGMLAPGYAADIAVLDPILIGARSDWDEPGRHAVGVVHVVVNGELALKDGALTGRSPGKFLERQSKQ